MRRLGMGLAILMACGGVEPPPTRREPPPPAPEGRNWREVLGALNARARERAVTETLHGTEVADPYRVLENDTAWTRRWIATQTERTNESLPVSDATRARLRDLLAIGSVSGAQLAGGGDHPERIVYERQDGGREQPALYVRERREEGEDIERLLVDPADTDAWGERAALDWYYASPDGQRLAFGISHDGDERSTLHVLDLEAETGALLPLRIPRTKWCNLAWLPDGSGFYYTRYPTEGEEGFDAEREDSYFPRVFFHAMADETATDDFRVFGAERPTDFPAPQVAADGRWLVINVFRGWSASDVYLFDRGRGGTRVAPQEQTRFTTVTEGHDSLTRAVAHGGQLYLHTNRGAPRYRLLRVDARRAAEVRRWEEVVPQNDAVLEDWSFAGDGLALHYIDDIRSRLYATAADGSSPREVELPTRGSIDGISGRPGVGTLAFTFSGYLQPPSLLSADTQSLDLAERVRVPSSLDLEPYEVSLERVASADGTEVPVHLIRKRGLRADGGARVLLSGYGGFNVTVLPRFSRTALYWLEQGGVYAVAHLRGGGELGEAWHRAGMRGNKVHVFEDFEAILGWLTTSGLSAPERIAITGGSNGGLLMGAMITRVPDRFRAAASYVGLYDMVRYPRFPPAELWISEYGDPAVAEEFSWLHGYSPYHRVREGVAYPAVLIETADHDSRVHWSHSTKFTAALQTASSSGLPVFFHMDAQQGHGAGTRLSDLVEKYARMYEFFDEQLSR